MHNWLQSIKTNNAFARRDYWVAASASLFWVMLTAFFVHYYIVRPDRLWLCIACVVFYSAVALLALVQPKLTAVVSLPVAMYATMDIWQSISDRQAVSTYDIVTFIATAQLFIVWIIKQSMADRRARREDNIP